MQYYIYARLHTSRSNMFQHYLERYADLCTPLKEMYFQVVWLEMSQKTSKPLAVHFGKMEMYTRGFDVIFDVEMY